MRSLALEAALVATAGPRAAPRAAELIAEFDRLATGLDMPHAHGMASGCRGVVAWFVGAFSDAVAATDRSAQIFREQCSGVAWERDTSDLFGLLALYRLGAVREIRGRVDRQLAEAEQRQDLYAATNLKSIFVPLLALADDAPDLAEAAAREATEAWSQAGYHVQHYNGFVGELRAALYRGDGPAALARLEREWPILQRSFLPSMHQLRVESRWLRATVCVAAAAGAPRSRRIDALMRRAMADARWLGREPLPWAQCLRQLVRGGVLSARERPEDAVAAYRAAADRAASVGCRGLVAAAHHRLAELVGGDEGAALRVAADICADGRGRDVTGAIFCDVRAAWAAPPGRVKRTMAGTAPRRPRSWGSSRTVVGQRARGADQARASGMVRADGVENPAQPSVRGPPS